MGQWCELPVNLLEELENRMNLYVDKVRIRAVCESWYTHLSKLPNKKEKKFPLLLKEIDDNVEATHALFNPIENKFYYIYLPEARGKLFKGSSHGWVAMIDDIPSTSPSDICLINPLTRALIKLPPRTKFPDVKSYRANKRDHEYTLYFGDCIYSSSNRFYSCEYVNINCTKKFVTLSNPCGNDCVVVAIYRNGTLAYCNSNDKKWKPIKLRNYTECFADIIVYKGKLHALTLFGEILCFESIGFGTELKVTVVAYKQIKIPFCLMYLVECSDGGLIMVARYLDFLESEVETAEPIPRTRYFDVYKLDMTWAWVEVKNIGNDILFVGLNSSFSLPSDHFPSCKGNHIYFGDTHYSYQAKRNNQVDADMGVFNLEDRTIEPLPRMKCYPGNFWPPAIWVNV